MKKVIMVCILAVMAVSLSASAFAVKSTSLWGTDNGYCAQWVQMYEDTTGVVTLGNNPHSNYERTVKGNSPHQRLSYFMQWWLCGLI